MAAKTITCIFLFQCIQFFSHCYIYSEKPNFVFVLTDDQDIALGGLIPLERTRKIIGEKGAEFSNMFVTTPLCCPSRSSILTGKYSYNHGVVNNSISGNCNSYMWQKENEPKTFITQFKGAGYTTFYAGKYLNKYGSKVVGGVEHVPQGWDHWNGLVGNSRYYNYTLSENGNASIHGDDPKKDYLTNVIFRKAEAFLLNHSDSNPFFMFLAPPASHAPFTPEPQFSRKFLNYSAPRTPNFNVNGGKTKHWLLRQAPNPLPTSVIQSIDEVFRNRWKTLLSVDKGIDRIYKILRVRNFLKNTFIIYTSDNGFHLGQFSLPWDKRQLYEFDIRVPLLIRGPGVKPGLKIKHPVLNIDLAPTFLSLAKIQPPDEMDGMSFAPLLKSGSFVNWRTSFVVEHQGESSADGISGCPQYGAHEVNTCDIDCICEDSWNNSYTCIREISETKNVIACIFKDNENFVEVYNITADPFQLNNLYPSMQRGKAKAKLYFKKCTSALLGCDFLYK